MVRYCVVLSRNKKVYTNSLNKARLVAMKYINERFLEEGVGRIAIYQGAPSKVPLYGIVGFDISRHEYYFIRNDKAYFLHWTTGAVSGTPD